MEYPKNEFIRISELSQMGSCETKFVDAIHGKLFQNKAMKIGVTMHKKLEDTQPKMSREEIVEKMRKGEEFWATEIPIRDYKFMLTGRIDRIYVKGKMNGGKNECLVIDYKYPKNPYFSIPTYYSIQLVAYVCALEHWNLYNDVCKVVGVQLVSREKETQNILSSVDMDREKLDTCEKNMATVVERAWQLKKGIQNPEHRRFDLCNGEWIGCYCKR